MCAMRSLSLPTDLIGESRTYFHDKICLTTTQDSHNCFALLKANTLKPARHHLFHGSKLVEKQIRKKG